LTKKYGVSFWKLPVFVCRLETSCFLFGLVLVLGVTCALLLDAQQLLMPKGYMGKEKKVFNYVMLN
jgi:hypothetical protein